MDAEVRGYWDRIRLSRVLMSIPSVENSNQRTPFSAVYKRSIVIAGHKTSISLEDAFWKSLKGIAVARNATLSELVASIDSQRQHGNLSSAIRLFVLDYYQSQSAADESAAPR